jgi:regulator of sirC expression with transglutaminase-like and TPR domain
MTSPATKRLQDIMARPDDDIDLAEAALVVAAEEYPELDVTAYLGHLDQLAGTLRLRLAPDLPVQQQIEALNRYLFDELGFRPNPADYYDPRNSFLNDVLDRRLGIPLTLSIVYIEIGRRIGLPLAGVSFPGHFLVRCAVSGGMVIIDPYSGGVSLSLEDLRERLKLLKGDDVPSEEQVATMLDAAAKSEVLVRMLRNLKAIYTNRGDLERALSCSHRIILIAPENVDELRERAALYLQLECFQAAITDFERYLDLAPDVAEAQEVREQLVELRRNAPRLN